MKTNKQGEEILKLNKRIFKLLEISDFSLALMQIEELENIYTENNIEFSVSDFKQLIDLNSKIEELIEFSLNRLALDFRREEKKVDKLVKVAKKFKQHSSSETIGGTINMEV